MPPKFKRNISHSV